MTVAATAMRDPPGMMIGGQLGRGEREAAMQAVMSQRGGQLYVISHHRESAMTGDHHLHRDM